MKSPDCANSQDFYGVTLYRWICMNLSSHLLIVKLKCNPASVEKFAYLGLKLVDIADNDHRVIYQSCLQCYDSKTQSFVHPFYEMLTPRQLEIFKTAKADHVENSDLEIKNIISNLKKETRFNFVVNLFSKYLNDIKACPEELEPLVDEFCAAIGKQNADDDWEDSSEVVKTFKKEIHARISGVSRMATPFETLNHILQGGTTKGELLILASMSNMGKSTLANQFMLHYAVNCTEGKSVAVIGLEMQADEYFAKTLAVAGRQYGLSDLSMANQALPTKYGINKEWEEFSDELARTAPQKYLKTKSLTIDELKKQMLVAVKVHKAEVILLDHLLLLDREDMREPENQYISRVTQMMKNFATEHGVLCIAVSQMRRGSNMTKADMSDMASSAGIERQATTLLVIHMHDREEGLSPDGSPFSGAVKPKIDPQSDNVRRITVAKARHAQRDRYILTRFYGNDSSFVEIEPDDWEDIKDELPTSTKFSWANQNI